MSILDIMFFLVPLVLIVSASLTLIIVGFIQVVRSLFKRPEPIPELRLPGHYCVRTYSGWTVGELCIYDGQEQWTIIGNKDTYFASDILEVDSREIFEILNLR